MNRIVRQSMFLTCVITALAMRAVIPAGYMPAAAGSGLLFELCPTAVPADVLKAIAGSEHHHDHSDGGRESHFNAEQCPIGQLLSVATAVDVTYLVSDAPQAVAPAVDVLPPPGSATPLNSRSRSPPA